MSTRSLLPRRVLPRPTVAGLGGATLLLAVLTAVLAGLVGPAAALTATPALQTSVAHVERTGSGFDLTVDVPAEADVALDQVTATIDGQSIEAVARPASQDTAVPRTAVLAIDTSNSMSGPRFDAARAAAAAFVEAAPADVAIGIVTFNSAVTTALSPTTDRASATQALDQLSLDAGTRLYDGTLAALDLAGTTGQRSVLVISDGADAGSTSSVEDVAEERDASGIDIDVVALEIAATREPLRVIAGAGGEVIPADSAGLASIFSAEAARLARQVTVSVAVPAEALAQQTSIQVALPTPAGTVQAATTVLAEDASPADPLATIGTATEVSSEGTPTWLMYGGIALVTLGLIVAAVVLVPAPAPQLTVSERVNAYADAAAPAAAIPSSLGEGSRPGDAGGPRSAARRGDGAAPTATAEPLAQAKGAAEVVLQRNRGLAQRIARRLEGAGSELKPNEWLLLHTAVFLASGVFALLLAGSSVVLALLLVVLGALGPYLYLLLRGSRRRRAFDAALPDTLQMMSGSLAAGLSLAQSVDTIVREGQEPMTSAFRRVLVETRLGVSLEESFEAVAQRFDSKDFAWAVMAIKIQRQVGGNLAELLNTVAATMREREYMRRQVNALAAEGKLSAWVLGLLPPLFLLYLVVAQGDYVGVMFSDPRGLVMLIAAGLWLGVGVFWMSRLIKVEV